MTVNNSRRDLSEWPILIGFLDIHALIEDAAVVNKQVHKNPLSSPLILIICPQFIESTETTGRGQNLSPAVSKIIPGNWGKAGSGWLVRPLQAPGRKARKAEAGFTGSSGGVRALPGSRKWNRAARHDEKPFRAD